MHRVWVVLFVVLLAACGYDKVVGSSTVTGTYTLRTVNGKALPFTMPGSGTTSTVVLDDRIILYEGGTFAQTGHLRVTRSGVVSDSTKELTGTYGLLGTSISFRVNPAGNQVIGAMYADNMTFVEDGVTSVFSK